MMGNNSLAATYVANIFPTLALVFNIIFGILCYTEVNSILLSFFNSLVSCNRGEIESHTDMYLFVVISLDVYMFVCFFTLEIKKKNYYWPM